ncbi:MAG: NAD-dependent epimerase/dehydratase family protein [Desulfobacteraceae bacterium]|nr:NAD-dependent epimerase/dehydratase family protein [Desulfobacteraceae bacterium]
MAPPDKRRQVLVTGGSGFLGRAIAARLVARGDRVRTLARRFSPDLQPLGVDQQQGDIADPAAVERACAGMEAVIHTAAKAGVWGPYETYYNPNVRGTQNVIAACRRQQVALLVHTSSPSVVFNGTGMDGVDESAPYPDQFPAPYPETKALAEQAVRAAADPHLRTVCLRPHLIWGPGDPHLAPRILARAGRLRRVGEGANRVDTIYIDNAAEAHLLALDRLAEGPGISGRVYFISQDEPIPLWEMIDRILAAGGKPPVTRSISPKAAYRIGTFCEWLHRTLRLAGEPPMTRFVAAELATSHWFDISAARRDLGYAPEVSIDEGLERLAEWLRGGGLEQKPSDGSVGSV